jgi:hypothetical protein
VLRSSNIDTNSQEWGSGGATKESKVDSVVKGENAFKYSGATGSDQLRGGAGVYSSSQEVIYVILEQQSADKVRFLTIGSEVNGNLQYNLSTESVVDSDGIETHARKLGVGPSGGTLWLLQVRYDPTSGTDSSGNSREVWIYPDRGANGNSTIFHHAQLEEARNASVPIGTGTSAVTREGDNVSISTGDWWNPDEGTFYIVFRALSFVRDGSHRILAEQGNDFGDIVLQRHSGDTFAFNVGGGGFTEFGQISPFTTYKYALSWDNDGETAVVDGGDFSTTNNGENGFDLSGNDLKIAERNNALIEVRELTYTPQRLSESTLNTLTS